MRFLQCLLWLCAALIPSGSVSQAAEPPKPRVLCSIAPLASWAINIAGNSATVELLLPADVGPHDFQFRPRDLKRIQSADLIVINGLGIEDWLEKPLRANTAQLEKKLVRVSDGLKSELIFEVPELVLDPKASKKGDHHGHSHGDSDGHPHGEQANPHIWLDPVLARHGVSNLLQGFIRVDPKNAENYTRNAQSYLARLELLDRELRGAIAGFSNKSIVTFHDAFPYFTRRYGLELVGVIEEVPGVEPSPKYLSELLKVVRAHKVKALFTEPQFSPRLASRLAKDLGVTVAELDVLETGRVSADFYESGIRRNLQSLQTHLR
jgi:zinc/manganese transport system substrate-binding protein